MFTNEVLAFVKKQMKAFSLRPLPDMAADGESPRLRHLMCLGKPFYLNADGWELVDEGKVDPSRSTRGLDLKHRDPFMTVNLYCGGQLTEDVQRWRGREDDREVYKELRSVADKYTHLLPAKVRGLHLFFHSGYSHLALTLLMYNKYWTRKYSVILPSWSPENSGEFVFDFAFIGGFRGYCRVVPLMDQLVRSLQW